MSSVAAPRAAARHVSVLIPSWNGRAHLETCLAALAEQRDPGVPWDVWVLDNGSQDGTAEWLEREWLARARPRVRLVRSERNLGFAAGVDRLVEAAADADLVAFCREPWRDPTKERFAFRPQTVAPADALGFRLRRRLRRALAGEG